MLSFRRAAMLLVPATVLAGVAFADPPAAAPIKGAPKVGDRLAVYKPAVKLNSTGARDCETC